MSFKNSALLAEWYSHVVEPPSNDFVIAISASGKSSMSRTGKTTLETALAQTLDQSATPFDASEQATLDAGELAYDIVPEVPTRSAVVLEEAQGSAGTTGMDARRGMKTEVIDSLNAILNNGDKELTVIITCQHLPMLDKRLPPMVDAWLLVTHGPSSPRGPLGVYHKMHVEDYNFGDPQIKTPAVEEFTWPRVPDDNPNYRILEAKKQKAKQRYSDGDDEDGELPKEAQKAIAQDWRDYGQSCRWISENVASITFSHEWVRQNTVGNAEVETA
jgi:hypothetical protein